jgi:hypothetical protein
LAWQRFIPKLRWLTGDHRGNGRAWTIAKPLQIYPDQAPYVRDADAL